MDRRRLMQCLAFGVGIAMVLLVLTSMLGMVQQPTYAASEITVCPDGTCDFTSIQAAVDAANAGDKIKVAEGIYAGVSVKPRKDVISTGVVTQVIYISKTVTLQGGYSTTFTEPPNPDTHATIVNPQGQGRGIYITGNVSPTIMGMQVTGGDARNQGGIAPPSDFDAGGGVYIVTATATISDCLIFSNTVDAANSFPGYGGGLYLINDNSTIQNNHFTFNTTSNANGKGGGVYLNNSTATVKDNRFEDNATGSNGDGGALYVSGGNLSLIDNTVDRNYASRSGGGINLSTDYATVSGNSIRENTTGVNGGGVYGNGSLILINNTIYSNTASTGGGVYLRQGTPTVIGNFIISNTSLGPNFNQGGGGMYLTDIGNDGELSLNEISGNSANSNGGGVFVYDSAGFSFDQNLLQGNNANAGGGLYVFYSRIKMDANTIQNNLANDGGGLYLELSDALLTNNLVAENEAPTEGSGFYIRRGAPDIQHTTIVGNIGSSGIYVTDFAGNSATPHFANTILTGHGIGIHVTVNNTATVDATIFDNGIDFLGGGAFVHTNDLFGDPIYMDPIAGDYHIQSNSPARDNGVNVFVTTDIDGQLRPQGSEVDIGADEYHPLPSFSLVKHAHPSPAQAGMPITYTIVLTNTGNTTLTATITDTLPNQVAPGGILVWNPTPIAITEIWTQTIVVTVDPGYLGILSNQVYVTTAEGPDGTAVNTVTTAKATVYLPVIVRRP